MDSSQNQEVTVLSPTGVPRWHLKVLPGRLRHPSLYRAQVSLQQLCRSSMIQSVVSPQNSEVPAESVCRLYHSLQVTWETHPSLSSARLGSIVLGDF